MENFECAKCLEIKPEWCYYIVKGKRMKYCKECIKKRNKEYYKNNKDYQDKKKEKMSINAKIKRTYK